MNRTEPIIPITIEAAKRESEELSQSVSPHTKCITSREDELGSIRDEEKGHHKANHHQPLEEPEAILDVGPGILAGLDADHDGRQSQEEGCHSHAHTIGCQVAHKLAAIQHGLHTDLGDKGMGVRDGGIDTQNFL